MVTFLRCCEKLCRSPFFGQERSYKVPGRAGLYKTCVLFFHIREKTRLQKRSPNKISVKGISIADLCPNSVCDKICQQFYEGTGLTKIWQKPSRLCTQVVSNLQAEDFSQKRLSQKYLTRILCQSTCRGCICFVLRDFVLSLPSLTTVFCCVFVSPRLCLFRGPRPGPWPKIIKLHDVTGHWCVNQVVCTSIFS